MPAPFVHLHLHTEYSIVDGLIRVNALMDQAAAAGMPAVALTDQGNLFAMVKFFKAAQARGIKPIIGAEVWTHHAARPGHRARLVLLCQDDTGYRNLSQLLTLSYRDGQSDGLPQVDVDWIDGRSQGLIALSDGRDGDIGQALLAGNDELARRMAEEWQALFPDRFYIELQRTGRSNEDQYIDAAVDLAAELDLPVVATNDVRFLSSGDYEAHEARVCIHEGRTLNDPRRSRQYSPQQYLRDGDEMANLFADLPEALANATQIAKRCNLELRLGKYHLPAFPVPDGSDVDAWLRRQAEQGLEQRLRLLFDPGQADFTRHSARYYQRLQSEIDVITRMGFSGYFLIVADFIRWAKDNGIPVGPGRGSGAGSLVAYSLAITELDPLRYDLLFERFLNPERISMPDFDVDFCMDRRDEVIHYVAERYGRDHVSQIITHGTMAAKAVVRDVGRVLGLPYGFVDQVAKLIPFALDMTLERAMAEEPALKERYDSEDDVRTLFDLALKLEGLTRNAGKHAGGVVIAPSPLTDFTPLYCEQGAGTAVTQLDMGDVEAIGLVKFDFLGLRTLTIIDWALHDINAARQRQGEPAIDINLLPLDDKAAYTVFAAANTTAIFQFESRGMRDLLKRAKPDRFEDIIALVALYRPGPMDLIPDFIDRKHGIKKAHYADARLEPILGPTYGVMVYQEQVMQIAQVIGGYSLGAADLLRRAMGKKKVEEMAKHRDIFVAGAATNGVKEAIANELFDLMEKFAGYGFNKSHAAAYALVAYQTAWLKAHYPAAFMAAVLSSDMDDTDKVVGLLQDCRRIGVEVLPPDIQASDYRFTVAGPNIIRYGLGAVKGVGQSAIEAIVGEREQNGPFRDLFELCHRIDTRRANRRVLEALLKAGVLDALGPSRGAMMASLGNALQYAEQHGRNQGAGQNDLFAAATDSNDDAPPLAFAEAPDWSMEERLLGEKATLGRPFSGHFIDAYEAEIAEMGLARIGTLKTPEGRSKSRVKVGGILSDVRTRPTRRGRMALLLLDDRNASLEVTAYSERYDAVAGKLEMNKPIVVEGDYGADNFSGEMALVADKIWRLDEARTEFAKRLVINLEQADFHNGLINDLAGVFGPHRQGNCPVWVEYWRDDCRARLRLGTDWAVLPVSSLVERLKARVGPDKVRIEY